MLRDLTDAPRSAGSASLGPLKRAAAWCDGPLVRVVIRRVLLAVPLLFVVSAVSFVLISLTPGDATHEILGLNAPPEAYARLRQELGLDLPLYEQYWNWLSNVFHGNFGASLFTTEDVTNMLDARLPVTLSLMAGALLVSVVLGVGMGVYSAARGGAAGRFVDALSLVGFALPSFWVGAVLIALFAVRLGWLPAEGYVPIGDSPTQWLQSLVLPVIALSLHGVAVVAKQTREAMLSVLGSEYIRCARASGISSGSILFRHALKNASMPVLTVLSVEAVSLLGGTVLIESVFALPGLGGLGVNASLQHDLPVVQGVVVYFTVIVVGINLLTDVAYSWLDPRVRAG